MNMSWIYQNVSYTTGNGFYTAFYSDKVATVSFNGVHFVFRNNKLTRVVPSARLNKK